VNATPDRRGLLLGALTAGAAATVVAVPDVAAAETPDAVFALLEVHRTALGRFEELDGSNHEAFTAAAATVDAALDEITSTPPTTVAGMRASSSISSGSTGTATTAHPVAIVDPAIAAAGRIAWNKVGLAVLSTLVRALSSPVVCASLGPAVGPAC
jgi:hypothetical protein